jgi:nickel-dependent lactate racemase
MARRSKYRMGRFGKEELFGRVLNYLIEVGFTEKEALWGANEPVDIESKQVQELVEKRKDIIEMYIGDGFTREKAIELASKDLESKLNRRNIKEPNIFYEVSL